MKWSERWSRYRRCWAESCSLCLASWKRTGNPAMLASSARFALLHSKALQRWMAAKAREGFEDTAPTAASTPEPDASALRADASSATEEAIVRWLRRYPATNAMSHADAIERGAWRFGADS